MEGKAFPKEGSRDRSIYCGSDALTVEVDQKKKKKVHTLVIFLWNAVLL